MPFALETLGIIQSRMDLCHFFSPYGAAEFFEFLDEIQRSRL